MSRPSTRMKTIAARTSVNQNSWLICSAPSEAGATGQGWAAADDGMMSAAKASGMASGRRRINKRYLVMIATARVSPVGTHADSLLPTPPVVSLTRARPPHRSSFAHASWRPVARVGGRLFRAVSYGEPRRAVDSRDPADRLQDLVRHPATDVCPDARHGRLDRGHPLAAADRVRLHGWGRRAHL